MNKIKVKIITVGYLIKPIDIQFLTNWKSNVIDVNPNIEEYKLPSNSDGRDWEFTDELLDKFISKRFEEDFTLAIVNVPIEDNYYTRRLTNNRVVATYFQVYEILRQENIPIENFIIHRIYTYSILFKKYGEIPLYNVSNSHDETRGCLFDMNPYKNDLIHSSEKPIICDDCYTKQSQEGVPTNFLSTIRKELKKIKKSTYHVIAGFVKEKPILAIIISFIFGLILNLTSSWVWELITKANEN